ncbi:MAG: tripartite tricarboxylate transporter substrate binding protein [Betaproteobacteria bacterium]|nr:tripartite tricarboxylate transporter substrate binding protein [Betaproteobacteria bacterium]
MPTRLRLLCWMTVITAIVAGNGAAAAQGFPARPIRIIVGFVPGGAADLSARMVAQALTERIGQPVLVENRSGAAGLIANELVAKSPPDGYTLLAVNSSLSSIPALYPKSGFDAARDLAAVALVCITQNALVVHPSVPVKTVRDVISVAKANPGKLNFSSSGTGSSTHLAGELFKNMAGVDFTHIPYKGQALAISAAVAGEIDLTFNSIGPLMPFVKAGRLRMVATTGSRRSALLPDVPTIAEAGVPGYAAGSWYGFAAPAKTPPDIVALLGNAIVGLLNVPEFLDQVRNGLGADPAGMTAQEMTRFMAADAEKWTRIITRLRIKGD